ncbi:hypothetical protein BGZ65_000371, partial [Modicella reniformis]
MVPNSQRIEKAKLSAPDKPSRPEYIGTGMESLLSAIEVHPALSASSASRSPSPFATGYTNSMSSGSTSPFSSPRSAELGADHATVNDGSSHASAAAPRVCQAKTISTPATTRYQIEARVSKSPKSASPTFSTIDVSKRKWSNLSSANFEEERNAKIRRSIQDHVSAHANPSQLASESEAHGNSLFPRQVFDTKNPSTRYQMTTICCLHASVAQKSYGSEKRFLCPPPIVTIQAPQGGDSKSVLSSRPQVTMSIVCENENNSTLGQRSTLEDDHTGTFRYLYVTGSAKAKSFQLKLQVYGRACLPNGFVSNDSSLGLETEEGVINTSDLPEPYAVFDSAPIAIISKPSKKTAKARNVSSCILAGSLVSLFNRINSQTVRTKYMSIQDDEFCAKNSTWSSFSITIVSNGYGGNTGNDNSSSSSSSNSNSNSSGNTTRVGSQSSSPVIYGAEIILTETMTGLKSDRLVICKVENGRIQENATGPICQMQKVALMSTTRSQDGEPLYLSAVGNDHQVGRYIDHSSTTKTVLKYQPSTLASGNTDIMKPGSDDFL